MRPSLASRQAEGRGGLNLGLQTIGEFMQTLSSSGYGVLPAVYRMMRPISTSSALYNARAAARLGIQVSVVPDGNDHTEVRDRVGSGFEFAACILAGEKDRVIRRHEDDGPPGRVELRDAGASRPGTERCRSNNA